MFTPYRQMFVYDNKNHTKTAFSNFDLMPFLFNEFFKFASMDTFAFFAFEYLCSKK